LSILQRRVVQAIECYRKATRNVDNSRTRQPAGHYTAHNVHEERSGINQQVNMFIQNTRISNGPRQLRQGKFTPQSEQNCTVCVPANRRPAISASNTTRLPQGMEASRRTSDRQRCPAAANVAWPKKIYRVIEPSVVVHSEGEA